MKSSAAEPTTTKRRLFYNAEREREKALVRAEIEKRGEAVVLAELEAATREIAAEMFAETSCREWIDGRFGPGVLHRATTQARRRVATTSSGAKPKPAFDLPPLDLPELVLLRLEGTPRQVDWANDLRRRAVRDWTEERANETARDTLRRLRDYESAFAEENRSDLEAAIKAVGGDDAAELILGREIYLEARQSLEEFRKARDWIDLKTSGKTLYDLPKFVVFGPEPNAPKAAAEILRRYAADAKKADQPEPRPRSLALEESREKVREILAERDAWKRERDERLRKIQARFSDVATLQNSPEYAKLSAAEHARVKAEIADLRQQLDALNDESAEQNWEYRVWGALFPVDNPESPNRKYFSEDVLKNFALRNNAKTTIKMTKKEREDAEIEIRRGLDFVGRVLDNVGVDVQDTR